MKKFYDSFIYSDQRTIEQIENVNLNNDRCCVKYYLYDLITECQMNS